ncbi:hypothetical protein Tco_1286628 [Tanacetum coccineum]
MFRTVPPIPPPPGTNPCNVGSPNKVDTIPNDNTNNTAHEGPFNTRDTKIAALRLKCNAFKALEGERVQGTFTRLKILLNDLENKGLSIPQAEVNVTFVNNLPRKWLSINQI